jgi:gliding motility-associated lipoprotein GldH
MKKIIKFSLLVFLILSCQPEGRIFYQNKDLSPNIEWLKKDSREFKIKVDDNSSLYDLGLMLRYVTGYQYDIAKVSVREISPSGKEVSYEYNLKIRDEKGKYIGNPGLDIWDSEHLVESGKKFGEKGTYTFILEHNMPKDPLHFVMEIGMFVDKSK